MEVEFKGDHSSNVLLSFAILSEQERNENEHLRYVEERRPNVTSSDIKLCIATDKTEHTIQSEAK